ncbi:hypothetical protein SAMN05421690_100559 [Nitrosomonas sp. Nm51]|uniref:hypothetical protein n=1 Tax=Nitrosomonas sp. Nm51 TaxID=133720 RepID=UPI0008B606C0|nr:hypothetical protein [Nitrosomonas sp. Nm51]SEQ99888.1 hypothetical protein SAMN05421690_100559 [Nitrosomonas sp. Nm51]
MSPLWRDRIDVFFAPGRIDLARSRRGLKPVRLPVITEPVANDEDTRPAWLQPVQQLEPLLADAAGAGMTVTLSNHFVRYATLPPQPEITSPEEVLAYANFRMREIYGARIDQWVLSVSAWSPIYGAICAAISQELFATLAELSARHQIRLDGIEPYFSAVLDTWNKALDRQRSFVALVETGRICVALLEDGVWQSLRNQRVLNDRIDALWAALDQEAVLSGQKAPVEQVFLFAPEHPVLTLPDESGWQIVSLQAGQMPVPRHYPAVVADKPDKSGEGACPA